MGRKKKAEESVFPRSIYLVHHLRRKVNPDLSGTCFVYEDDFTVETGVETLSGGLKIAEYFLVKEGNTKTAFEKKGDE